jgi:hypothetical protein
MNDAPAVQKPRGSLSRLATPTTFLLLFASPSQSHLDPQFFRWISSGICVPFRSLPRCNLQHVDPLGTQVISRTKFPAAHRSWINPARQLDESIDTSPASATAASA